MKKASVIPSLSKGQGSLLSTMTVSVLGPAWWGFPWKVRGRPSWGEALWLTRDFSLLCDTGIWESVFTPALTDSHNSPERWVGKVLLLLRSWSPGESRLECSAGPQSLTLPGRQP